MSQPGAGIATGDMGTEARAPVRTTPERPAAERASPPGVPLAEFEQVYLRNVEVLMGYFARRCRDPHTVADLTSETFVRAMDGFAGVRLARAPPRRGAARGGFVRPPPPGFPPPLRAVGRRPGRGRAPGRP